jgi:hypothetical protein
VVAGDNLEDGRGRGHDYSQDRSRDGGWRRATAVKKEAVTTVGDAAAMAT